MYKYQTYEFLKHIIFFLLKQQENLVPVMKRPSHLQVVPDHESSHLRELLRVKDQELKGRHLSNLLYFRSYSYPHLQCRIAIYSHN